MTENDELEGVEDLEALLELARGADAAPQRLLPAYMHPALIRKWLNFYGFKPGATAAGRVSDLYQHFLAYVREELGHSLTDPSGGRLREGDKMSRTFSSTLKRFGFQRKMVKSWMHGKPQREIMMTVPAAAVLRQWILQNGHKPGENPWYLDHLREINDGRRRPDETEALVEAARAAPDPDPDA